MTAAAKQIVLDAPTPQLVAQIVGKHRRDEDADGVKRIHPSDEMDLVWFMGYGQTIFGGSTWGAMLERAYAYSRGTKCCPRCSGTGFAGNLCACPMCCGMGFLARALEHTIESDWTARPKPGRREESGYIPDDEELARYARCSRLLERVSKVDTHAAEALMAFYSDKGTHWEAEGLGRIFAVFPLTGAGGKLLADSQKEGTTGLIKDASEMLGVEQEVNRSTPTGRRSRLLHDARTEAAELYRRGVLVWNEVRDVR